MRSEVEIREKLGLVEEETLKTESGTPNMYIILGILTGIKYCLGEEEVG